MKQAVSAFLSLTLIFGAVSLYAVPIPSHPIDNCQKYQSETDCTSDCSCVWYKGQICVKGDNRSAPCVQAEKELNIVSVVAIGLISLSAGYFIYKLWCKKLLPDADDYSATEYDSV
jgi:hypothetical protein